MYERECELKEVLSLVSGLDSSESISYDPSTGKIVYRTGISPYGTIFKNQMVALSLVDDPSLNIARVMSLILISGVIKGVKLRYGNKAKKEVEKRLFLATEWGRNLYLEYKKRETKASRFAELCETFDFVRHYPGEEPVRDERLINDLSFEFLEDTNALIFQERQGWLNYRLGGRNIETVADASVASQVHSVAVYGIYDPDYIGVDMDMAIMLQSIRSIGIVISGDITPSEPIRNIHKVKYGAFNEAACTLDNWGYLRGLYDEYLHGDTPQARFANMNAHTHTVQKACEYDYAGRFNMKKQEDNPALKDLETLKIFNESGSIGEHFANFALAKYVFDNNFKTILEFAYSIC